MRIRKPADPDLTTLSLVHRPARELSPPGRRPDASLSNLEQALAARNASEVRTFLREGADPHLVCPVRLREAASADADGAACARLIRVAGRMQRLGVTAPPLPAVGTLATSTGHVTDPRRASAMDLANVFRQGRAGWSGSRQNDPITRALANYDIEAAETALKKKSALPAMFARHRRHDRLIAALCMDNTSTLAKWHENGRLRPSQAPADDPALKHFLKQFSYRKVQTRSNRLAFLNNKTSFTNTKEKIVCRHLAVHWLFHRSHKADGKIDYAALSSKKNLQAAFGAEHQMAYEYYTANCTSSHLVDNKNWGHFLASQLRELQHPDADTATKKILISSGNHAMACELSIKNDAAGQPVYKIDFYDPNITNSYRKLRTPAMETIESLSMERLINSKYLSRLYYKRDSLSMAFVIDGGMARIQANDGRRATGGLFGGIVAASATGSTTVPVAVETMANRKLSSRPVGYRMQPGETETMAEVGADEKLARGEYVFHLMQHGFSGELDSVMARISAMPDKTLQMDALNTSHRIGGATPLIQAMMTGFENAASAFTSALLAQDGFSSDQKTHILSQQCITKGVKLTGLQAALDLDDQKMVGSFTRLVLASDALSDDQKCRILDPMVAGKNVIYGSLVGMRRSITLSGKAFRDAVISSGVPPAVRARLLNPGPVQNMRSGQRNIRSLLSSLRT